MTDLRRKVGLGHEAVVALADGWHLVLDRVAIHVERGELHEIATTLRADLLDVAIDAVTETFGIAPYVDDWTESTEPVPGLTGDVWICGAELAPDAEVEGG